MADLQVHNFQDSLSAFTFIPYNLKPGVSKEAVKVHVLHERKRVRGRDRGHDQRTGSARPNAATQLQAHEQMLWWDSKANGTTQQQQQQQQVRNGHNRTIRRHNTTGPKTVTALARYRPRARYPVQPEFSLGSQLLRNPLVEQMRGDFGISSPAGSNATNFLVDHYLGRLGPSKFPRELLACYWQDSASFKAFLAHAAVLYSIETGCPPPIHVEALMGSALREIRRRVGDPQTVKTGGTVLAVTILANVEEIRSQHTAAACHWRGLKHLLRANGGLLTLRQNHNLHTMLFWREMMTSNSTDLCLGHGTDENADLQDRNGHIVDFYQNFADRLWESGNLGHNRDLHNLVALVNCNSAQAFEYASSMRRRTEMACLTYLAMLALNSEVSAESRGILAKVNREVTERSRWGEVNSDELLFVMLLHGNSDHLWRCQRLWQLSRCVYLTRTLDVRDWKTVRDMLCLSMGIEGGCDSRISVVNAWSGLSMRLAAEDEQHQVRDGRVTNGEGLANLMI